MLLRAADEIAFQHEADERAFAGGDLGGEIGGDVLLLVVFLAAVVVAAIHQHHCE